MSLTSVSGTSIDKGIGAGTTPVFGALTKREFKYNYAQTPDMDILYRTIKSGENNWFTYKGLAIKSGTICNA